MDTLSDMVMVVPRPPMMSRKITSCPDISWASTFYFILFYYIQKTSVFIMTIRKQDSIEKLYRKLMKANRVQRKFLNVFDIRYKMCLINGKQTTLNAKKLSCL
jgi:hypothetical protein